MKIRSKNLLAGIVALSMFGGVNAQAATWLSTATGAGPYNWNDNANWTSPDPFPNAVGAVANVVRNITVVSPDTAQTINLSDNVTVGSLTVGDSTSSYFATFITASAGKSLTFDNGGISTLQRGGANNSSNVFTIQAPVTVVDNLKITVGSTGSINLDGALNGTNTAVIETGGTSGSGRSIRFRGDLSGFGGTFKHSQGATSNGLRFGDGVGLTVDGSNAKFEFSGTTTFVPNAGANTSISLGAGSSIFKMGELSGPGGILEFAASDANASMILEVGHLNTNSTWSGVYSAQLVTQTANFTKVGSGILDLKGNNLYNGVTNVNVGTLLVNGSHTTGLGYAVAANATLGGEGTISALVDLSGSISAGGSVTGNVFANTADTLTVGGLTLQNGSSGFFTLDATNPLSVNNDLIAVTGALTGTGGTVTINVEAFGGGLLASANTWNLANYNSLAGTLPTFVVNGVDPGYSYSVVPTGAGPGSVQLTLTAVPEPSTFALAGLGLVGLAFIRKRRMK